MKEDLENIEKAEISFDDFGEEDLGEVTKSSTLAIVDVETGEILRQFPKKPSKEGAIKEKVDKDILEFQWRTNMFVKLYCSEELPPYDSDKFLVYWVKLSKKLSQSTNVIVKRGKTSKQDTPMTKEDMIDLLNISERTFYSFLKESMDKNIIVKNTIEGDCTRVQYVMNPLYIFNGQNINYYTFELFKHDKNFKSKVTNKMLTSYLSMKKHLEQKTQ